MFCGRSRGRERKKRLVEFVLRDAWEKIREDELEVVTRRMPGAIGSVVTVRPLPTGVTVHSTAEKGSVRVKKFEALESLKDELRRRFPVGTAAKTIAGRGRRKV